MDTKKINKMYYSQSNQDKWVVEFLKFKKNGYFIELGAYDGIQTSNTYYMEKNLGWEGLCVEANPRVYESLIKNRTSKNINVALNNYVGECFFTNDKITTTGIRVSCNTLDNILKENNCPKDIDYLSIDIEGYEYIVLKDFNFKEWNIGLMTVEHNLYCDGNDRKNKLRIDYIVSEIKAGKLEILTIEGLATSSGFASRSNFNKAFFTNMNLTPSEYIKSLKK